MNALQRKVLRAKTAFGYYKKPLRNIWKWLNTSKEITNFTYDLDPLNMKYLAAFISNVTKQPYQEAFRYILELQEDQALKDHIKNHSSQSSVSDSDAKYGRRLGWYAFARILKPRVVVESGVDQGLGACVITAALRRNAADGTPGHYYGTDINKKAGFLLSGEYAASGTILYGDSVTSLKAFEHHIDLFINDSDHEPEYEAEEYKIISNKLSEQAVILGDNSHCTDVLLRFALETGRQFFFFKEQPQDHWYPGGGIGIAIHHSLKKNG